MSDAKLTVIILALLFAVTAYLVLASGAPA